MPRCYPTRPDFSIASPEHFSWSLGPNGTNNSLHCALKIILSLWVLYWSGQLGCYTRITSRERFSVDGLRRQDTEETGSGSLVGKGKQKRVKVFAGEIGSQNTEPVITKTKYWEIPSFKDTSEGLAQVINSTVSNQWREEHKHLFLGVPHYKETPKGEGAGCQVKTQHAGKNEIKKIQAKCNFKNNSFYNIIKSLEMLLESHAGPIPWTLWNNAEGNSRSK